MKKQFYIIFAVLLMSLSSCVKNEPKPEITLNPVTELMVRDKIKSILNVDGIHVIQTNFKIESDIVKEDRKTITVSVTTVKGLTTTLTKVTLHYLAMVNNYVYTNYDAEVLSSIMAEGPTKAQAMAGVEEAMMFQQSFYNVSISTMSFPVDELQCLQSEPLPEDGTFYMTCSRNYRMLETAAKGTVIIKADYTYNKGWTYTIDSWSLDTVTKFNTVFDLKFTSTFANPDQWFTPSQTAKLALKGTLNITFRSDKSITIDNQLTGSLTSKGVTMPLTVEAAKEPDYSSDISPNSLKLIFGSEENAYLVIEAVDGMGHCGPASPPYWTGTDGDKNYFMVNESTKSMSPFTC